MPKLSKIPILIFLISTLVLTLAFSLSHSSQAEDLESQEGPQVSNRFSVYVCPQAKSLEEINPRCPGRVILGLGKTIEGMTLTITNYEGKDYYLVLGLENGGGAVNLPPIANANGPYQGYAGLPIVLDASASSDPNNDPLEYRWDFDSDGNWDTDWSDNPKIEHIFNNDYDGVLRLEVSDGQFSDLAATSIKIKSARTLKQEVVSDLKSVKTGNRKTDKRIDRIIWFLNQSLNEDLWQDASHLVFFDKGRYNKGKQIERLLRLRRPLKKDKLELMKLKEIKSKRPRSGMLVFHYEKIGVRLMMNEVKLIKFKRNPDELKTAFDKAIEKLVKADFLLAKVSLFKAKNTEVQDPKLKRVINRLIKKAERELIQANKEIERKRSDKAITRLSHSWLHSQLAIKLANRRR